MMKSIAKIFITLLIILLQLTSCAKNVSYEDDASVSLDLETQSFDEGSYPFELDLNPQNIVPDEDIMLVDIKDFEQVFDKQLEYDYEGLVSPLEMDNDLERISKRKKKICLFMA